ncbi:MAG: hypothetical protein J6T74_01115 [Clostridia bacterium]|nr:hypothetical protein [Clostridia bacterium]
MEKIQVRLTDTIIDWVKKQADIEGVPVSTMIRLILDREMFKDEIKKQFDKKKRGNK